MPTSWAAPCQALPTRALGPEPLAGAFTDVSALGWSFPCWLAQGAAYGMGSEKLAWQSLGTMGTLNCQVAACWGVPGQGTCLSLSVRMEVLVLSLETAGRVDCRVPQAV